MDARARLATLADAMERDLRRNVLPFWARQVPDREKGGFLGFIADDGTIDPEGPRGGVLNARILWTFAAAARRFGGEEHRAVAQSAYRELTGRFWDEEHGGIYWMLDRDGRVVSDRKQTYALAFGLYGLAEYHQATGDAGALERAVDLYRCIETHARDPEGGGYLEARRRDWGPLEDVRLSEKDSNSPRSMNTHLHVMEAYTNLLRAWDEEGLRGRLGELIEIHLDRIVDADTGHLLLFFDEAWEPADRAVSYGHDIEASWLLVEAAEVCGDADLLERSRAAATKIARVTLDEAVDPEHGGLYAERDDGGLLDDEKHWWMQAEAIVGFVNAWELTGDEGYVAAAEQTWRFVEDHLIDRLHGEWRWRVARDGSPLPGLPKVEPWKCPYHNSRAALEVLARTPASRRSPGT